jgi:hypothetical protein
MSGTAMAGINFFTMLGPGVFIHALGDVLQSKAASIAASGAYRIAFLTCVAAVLTSLGLYATTRDTSGRSRGTEPHGVRCE